MKKNFATETEIRTASLIARRAIAQRRYAEAVRPQGTAAEVQEAADLRGQIERELRELIGWDAAAELMTAADLANGVTAQGYARPATDTPEKIAQRQGEAAFGSKTFAHGIRTANPETDPTFRALAASQPQADRGKLAGAWLAGWREANAISDAINAAETAHYRALGI